MKTLAGEPGRPSRARGAPATPRKSTTTPSTPSKKRKAGNGGRSQSAKKAKAKPVKAEVIDDDDDEEEEEEDMSDTSRELTQDERGRGWGRFTYNPDNPQYHQYKVLEGRRSPRVAGHDNLQLQHLASGDGFSFFNHDTNEQDQI